MAKSSGEALMEYIRAPKAKYTMVGEAIRYVLPTHMQCSLGCGGQDCKYDNPSYWRDDQQAIKGLYSSWITDHLLAMSRPSTEIIEKYNIIDQFKRAGIKSVINLQTPGEHASCGNPLEPDSGFSYRPEFFMANHIYFYNFGWDDYGVAELATVLDMLKVMAFALQDGKVAVHCHAGLGRTGVLLACFLAYATRMTADQAISYVRAKRPNSIQTRSQLRCVRQFVQFLAPLRSVFSCAEPRSGPVTLSQYLTRQRHMLHGPERKTLRHLPKIVQLVCRLLLDIAENRQVIEEDVFQAPDIRDIEETLSIVEKLGPEALAKEPRLPGTATLPRHFKEPPLCYHRKSLSYSESDLRRLGTDLNLLRQPLGSASPGPSPHQAWKKNTADDSHGSTGSLWQIKDTENGKDGGAVQKHGSVQRSEPVGRYQPSPALTNGTKCEGGAEQSELSLLVAQALAVDLGLDGDTEHKSRVSTWQAELNQGGAWARLCAERDPFVLSGLMWAWLEQLREPVFSERDVEALTRDPADPRRVLNALHPAQAQTLTCILTCMARMAAVPADVEKAFVRRTVKALAWVDTSKEDESKVSMTTVLRRLLKDLRQTVTEESRHQPH